MSDSPFYINFRVERKKENKTAMAPVDIVISIINQNLLCEKAKMEELTSKVTYSTLEYMKLKGRQDALEELKTKLEGFKKLFS